MNAKQKEILQVQRTLLSRNIVWTPMLVASLKAQNLLTDSMVAEIEMTEGSEAKINLLLDLLPLRTVQVYEKFADALHVAGHSLLADFLREEDASKHPLNVKDMFKRLPFLSQHMKESEKKQIESYMAEKIQAGILAYTWQRESKEKDKALFAKQVQLEHDYQHEQEMRLKQEQLAEAERLAREAREETAGMRAELRALSETMQRMEENHRGQIHTQMRFSQANDSMVQRAEQRLAVAEEALKTIQEKLSTVMTLSPRTKDRDLMRKAENPYVFLPEDIEVFIAQFKKLLIVQLQYDDLKGERNAIMTHMGLPVDGKEQHNFLSSFKAFAAKNEETITSLKKELEKYRGTKEPHKAKAEDASKEVKVDEEQVVIPGGSAWQNAILSVMRKQLQEVKATLRKKETTISIKEEEIGKLRSHISELEQQLAHKAKVVELSGHNPREAANGNSSSSVESDNAPTVSGTVGNHLVSPKLKIKALPPLKSPLKTSSSPRPSILIRSRPTASMPRGGLTEVNGDLNIYSSGLITTQLKVQRDAGQQENRAKGSQMGSTLGDLKAMNTHKSSASRSGKSVHVENSGNPHHPNLLVPAAVAHHTNSLTPRKSLSERKK